MDQNLCARDCKLNISILVPSFNEAAVLPEQLPMFEALAEHAEVIFCDGGSSDGSWEMLQATGFHCVQSAAGRALQMNTAAKYATGDVLLFVHIDTHLGAEHLRAMQHGMHDKSVVGGRFDVRLSGEHPMFRVIESMINLRSRWSKISTGDQCQFVQRDVFEKIGGFPHQALMEDVEFSKRLKSMGKITCLREVVETSSRRWEKNGIFKTIGLMWKLRFLYWRGVSAERLAKMYR